MGVAKMLLEAGADVETPDNYGQTPFFMACWKGLCGKKPSSCVSDVSRARQCDLSIAPRQ